ncbi:TPA: helix-turn-helix transcriptional regulator [Acinetobacter baumannii]|jgi:transcriptional regulator with XRE-family HTH domain|nr:helix-turn-helix transcriptional regulator [Acinetobacter baumannii]
MKESLLSDVSQTLRILRKEKNLTQDELSYLAGLDRTYISGIERGIRNLTINSLEEIIKALNLSPDEFLDALIKYRLNKEQNSGS